MWNVFINLFSLDAIENYFSRIDYTPWSIRFFVEISNFQSK